MAASARDLESDADLVHAVQSGETEAFDELFRRHYESVRRSCNRKLGNAYDADEVAQATFVRALERIEQCRGHRRFGPWVQVIAQRLCVDTLRARARVHTEESPLSADAEGTAVSPEESFLHDERARELHQALAQIPRRQREAVVARTLHERRPGEIAATLGLSIGAVDSLLLRAKHSLAAVLHRVAGEGGAIDPITNASAAATIGSGVAVGPRRIADSIATAAAHIHQTGAQLASTVGIASSGPPPVRGLGTAVFTATLAVTGVGAGAVGGDATTAHRPAAAVGRPLPGMPGVATDSVSSAVAASLQPLLGRIAAAIEGVVPVPPATGFRGVQAAPAPATPAAALAPVVPALTGVPAVGPGPAAVTPAPAPAPNPIPGVITGLLGAVPTAPVAPASGAPAPVAPTASSASPNPGPPATPAPAPAPAIQPVTDVLAPLAATIAGVSSNPPAAPAPTVPVPAPALLPPSPVPATNPVTDTAAAALAPVANAAGPVTETVAQVPTALPAAAPLPLSTPAVVAPVTGTAQRATDDLGAAAGTLLGPLGG